MSSAQEIWQRLRLTERAVQALDSAGAYHPQHELYRRYVEAEAALIALRWAIGDYGWPRWLTPTAIEREIAELEEGSGT